MGVEQNILVAGMGKTGESIAHFLDACSIAYHCCDDAGDYASCVSSDLSRMDYIFKSPGLRPEGFADIASQRVINDVELLMRLSNRPMFLVTGTNGKSTVVELLQRLLRAHGIDAIACGNNGVPALVAYAKRPQIYILELSSYQLENLHSHACDCAVVLNVGIDHVDRYSGMDDYTKTKERIYRYAGRDIVPVNLQGEMDYSVMQAGYRAGDTVLLVNDGFIYRNGERYLDLDTAALIGKHNHLNICAALAMLDHLAINFDTVASVLQDFTGLQHRMELVYKDEAGRRWINDSKSTNVHSTNAALDSLTEPVVLIMGGRGKGEDYSGMLTRYSEMIHTLVLFGEDARLIEQHAQAVPHRRVVDTVGDAVTYVVDHQADVLFSPACASFDQYENFAARGDDFRGCVQRMMEL